MCGGGSGGGVRRMYGAESLVVVAGVVAMSEGLGLEMVWI